MSQIGKNVGSCLNLVKQTQKLSTSSILKSGEESDETVKEPSTWFSNLLGYTQSEEETKVEIFLINIFTQESSLGFVTERLESSTFVAATRLCFTVLVCKIVRNNLGLACCGKS